MTQYAIIVDPVSSGKYLPDEFASRGISCLAVLSNPVPAEFQCGFAPQKYAEVILFDGDLAALAARLATFSPICVMVGLETGLDLMDKLAAKLGLPGNDPATSSMRRDKYEMHAALQRSHVRAAKQHRADNLTSAETWLTAHQAWPVVVKPSNSAGSDNVSVCDTLEQSLHAVAEILAAKNLFGEQNDCAVLQEYLDGREWVVDTVSCAGQHVVTNVTRYLKSVTDDAKVVYRHSEFMSPANPEFQELIAYALSVNDALGVRYGAAHLEIIMTANGPTLVELNGRMHGCDAIKALGWCYQVTQLDLSVDAYIDPAAFARKARQEFKNEKFMIAHYLIAPAAGTVVSVVDAATLRSIGSYKSHCLPSVGKVIQKTVSLTTSPGNIWLLNDDEEALMADQKKLIEMEQTGSLYSLAAA
jgi:carbamoylphosphate synthase large subunit